MSLSYFPYTCLLILHRRSAFSFRVSLSLLLAPNIILMFVVLLWPVCRCLFVSSASPNFQALRLLILISFAVICVRLLLSCVRCEILFWKRTTLWRGLAGLTIRKKTSVYCLWFLRLNCCNFCWLSWKAYSGAVFGMISDSTSCQLSGGIFMLLFVNKTVYVCCSSRTIFTTQCTRSRLPAISTTSQK